MTQTWNTEGGGEVGISQPHSSHSKWHMTKIYLMTSDGGNSELVKDHKELYDKTNEHFKDMDRKECLWERLANSRKLSVKVCMAWLNPKGLINLTC